jgi:hypothetical protein
MKLKTEFWTETNHRVWYHRYDKLLLNFGIFGTMNFIVYVFTNNTIGMIINALPPIIAILGFITQKKANIRET